MTAPANPADPQRSTERGDDPAVGRATPAPVPTRATGMGAVDAGAKRKDEEDEDEWRHEPIAPVDESNPLRSLGKAISDTVTGAGKDAPAPPKR